TCFCSNSCSVLLHRLCHLYFHFLLHAPSSTEIYTLSLHDALPILGVGPGMVVIDLDHHPRAFDVRTLRTRPQQRDPLRRRRTPRSEEHTSELQSPYDLVCRLLLEKKKREK